MQDQLPSAVASRAGMQERIHAGIARARRNGTKSGKAIGHPRVSAKLEATIGASLFSGDGIHKTAKACDHAAEPCGNFPRATRRLMAS